ncbi:hypothetical protein GCM10011350_40510 [Marinomonas arctica]|nr:hypothetical protein GCM10011350_40510 [Marinomonas arctica]
MRGRSRQATSTKPSETHKLTKFIKKNFPMGTNDDKVYQNLLILVNKPKKFTIHHK